MGMRDKEASEFVLWEAYHCEELVISINETPMRLYRTQPRLLCIIE